MAPLVVEIIAANCLALLDQWLNTRLFHLTLMERHNTLTQPMPSSVNF